MDNTRRNLIDPAEYKAFLKRYIKELHEVDAPMIAGAVERCLQKLEMQATVDTVEVPCKMGDMVWGIKIFSHGKKATQGIVNQMYFGEDMRICICVKNVCRGEWGKNVFATKEEAEAAIGEREGNG